MKWLLIIGLYVHVNGNVIEIKIPMESRTACIEARDTIHISRKWGRGEKTVDWLGSVCEFRQERNKRRYRK